MDSQPTPTGHVFISYAREDQTYARELADGLHKRGLETWMDDRIDFGDRWWQTIVQAIHASAAFVVVMTPDAEQSEWVEREILLAQRERKPIFPLLLRGQGIPLLVTTQYANVIGGRMPPDTFYGRLKQAVLPNVERHPPTYRRDTSSEAPIPTVLERIQPFEPETILIPAGEFVMGSNPIKDRDAHDREQPQHFLYLPDYYLGKTPVTNIEYLAFVQATGSSPPSHWISGRLPIDKEDHPVVGITWYEAQAYCSWLAEVTRKPYQLPSEAEWEKGARGTDGRIYPWGDQWDPGLCNTKEGGDGDTVPVDSYPGGTSPYGILDVAGNIWEWTRSLWGKGAKQPTFRYPYDPTDGRENLEVEENILRVVRSGSFEGNQILVRCAYRTRYSPSHAFRGGGFRVCVISRQD
jgi:formylglycine-generating enzyme required for sulfatase activity